MKNALRSRIILLALVLMIGQLTLVVHTTVHDAEINCQLCLNQSHGSKGIPVAKFDIPQPSRQNEIFTGLQIQNPSKPLPKAYSQRAPPFTS
jgi:hypothetical protein